MELASLLPNLAIIAGERCFCPGLAPNVMETLDRLQHPAVPIAKWPEIDLFISHKVLIRSCTSHYQTG